MALGSREPGAGLRGTFRQGAGRSDLEGRPLLASKPQGERGGALAVERENRVRRSVPAILVVLQLFAGGALHALGKLGEDRRKDGGQDCQIALCGGPAIR